LREREHACAHTSGVRGRGREKNRTPPHPPSLIREPDAWLDPRTLRL